MTALPSPALRSRLLDDPGPTIVSLPETKTLQKRPLLRPPIPAPSSGDPKIIYISTKTPFISAVKRIEGFLDAEEVANVGHTRKRQRFDVGTAATVTGDGKGRPIPLDPNRNGGVTLKATGKAIDRCLRLATFFMGKGEEVRVTTGSVGVVDDVVDLPEAATKREKRRKKPRGVGQVEKMEVDVDEGIEMVARTISTVQVLIFRKKAKN